MRLRLQFALASLLLLAAELALAATIFELPTDAQMVRESSAIVVGVSFRPTPVVPPME